mgnify:CR=1 FL=1|jgi:hypothetical protein
MLSDAGVIGTIKLVVVPKENDVLFMRVENLADLDSAVGTLSVNMMAVADTYKKYSAGEKPLSDPTIIETSLTGNM